MKKVQLHGKINGGESFDLGVHEMPDDADPKKWFAVNIEPGEVPTDFVLDLVFAGLPIEP